MSEVETFDSVWEEKYSKGHLQLYPWDMVVSFVFRNYPRDIERREVCILEVGCGAASNLWFAAREGFTVAGVDGSHSAIETAKQRFAADGLEGDLRVADFTTLPFEDESFHLVIDRGAITCSGLTGGIKAVSEVRRVLKPGGKFLFNPYSDRHASCAAGEPGPDGVSINISGGTLTGVGQICFYNQDQVRAALAGGWQISSLQHTESMELQKGRPLPHCEWRIVAQKVTNDSA
tara:strand:+ start:1494 stop:2192 length:699 start_codon:yes stop_codon:yes gene_type:complete